MQVSFYKYQFRDPKWIYFFTNAITNITDKTDVSEKLPLCLFFNEILFLKEMIVTINYNFYTGLYELIFSSGN